MDRQFFTLFTVEIKGAGEMSEDDEDNEEGLEKVQSARTVQEESEEVLRFKI